MILAIDPPGRSKDGSGKCGWAHSNGEHGVWLIGSKPHVELFAHITDALNAWPTDEIAFEDAGFASPHNMQVMANHAENRGIILLIAEDRGLPTIAYNPRWIKKTATGSGDADKAQMMRACKTFLGITPATDDVADALMILYLAEQGLRPEPKKAKARRVRQTVDAKQMKMFGKGKVRQVRR